MAVRRWSVLLTASTALTASSAVAQIDPSGNWRTWHTTHFRIHARAEAESLALRAAAEAERAYERLSGELVGPRGRIDVALGDNVDVSNAFASFFPSNRLVVFVTPPAGSTALAHYDDWLGLVFTHELVHLFYLDRSRGIWRVGQAVFGRLPGLFPNAYRPSWVSEGLATYYESRYTAAGRMEGGIHAQLLAAAARDRWPGPNDATQISPKWPDGFLPYAWGSPFFQWQSDRYGDSVIPGFIERTSRRLWPLTVSGPLKDAGGQGVGGAWRAIREAWADRAGASDSGAVIASGLYEEPRPQLSPDGRYLAYVHVDGRDDPRAVVRDLAAGMEAWRHRINAGVELAWVDSALVVAQLDFSSPVEIRRRLYRWVPGGVWDPVPNTERLTRPFAAPGGGIAAVDLGAHASRVVNVPGREPLAAPPADAWAYIVQSPDGSWLAGSRHSNGQWDIVLWPPGRPQDAVEATRDAAVDDDPSWAPAGDRLLFTSERGERGIPQIFAFRPADGFVEQLTWEPAGARQPALTADGTLIYVTMRADGRALVERPLPPGRPASGSSRPEGPREPAPAVAARETGYAPWTSLRPHFWIPTWHDEGTTGRFAGALTAGIDAVGRTNYVAHVAVSSRGRVEGLLDVEHRRWKALSLTASLRQTWDSERVPAIVQSTGDTVQVIRGDRELTLSTGGMVRWRRWRTAVTARMAAEWEQDGLVIDSPVGLRLTGPTASFAGPVVSLGLGRVTQPPLAISPENGAAVGLLYRRRWELGGARWFAEIRGAANGYVALPLPGFAHWVLALRGAVGLTGGSAPPTFEIGGTSGDRFEALPGFTVGAGRRQFPLRGYAAGGRFTRVATGVVELRVPVALIARGIWILPIGVDRISLTGFAETGGGWQAGQSAALSDYRDVGGEAVFDLAVSYDVPLRLRFGAGVPLTAAGGAGGAIRGQPMWYLTFGTAF